MIYPIDVHAKAKRGQKLNNTDKVKLGLGVLLIINIAFTVLFSELFVALGIPLIVVIIMQAVLFVFIFIMVFRFVIFREQDRDLDESDIFMQYYKLRPGSRKVTLPIGEVDLFELKNNSFMAAVQFKYGSSDVFKKRGTEEFLTSVVNALGEKKLSHRFLVLTESFMETPEFEYHLKKINSIKEPILRATLLNVYSSTFDFTEKNSSAETIVLLIYATGVFGRDDLEDSLVQIDAFYQKMIKRHSFRKKEVLDSPKLLEIFRQFYAMGAVDLSLSKIQLNAKDDDMLKAIIPYRVIAEDGSTYTNPIFDKIGTSPRRIN